MKSKCFKARFGEVWKNKANQVHRTDGPAVIAGAVKQWWINGQMHRTDGPACMGYKGKNFWYIRGEDVTEEITKWANSIDMDLDNVTPEDELIIRLKWDTL